ncbi:MAG: HPr family phosphocarrier protein [Planctomycetes bacterium]|nr:HPr family phosphocarrier protein [Planctomycetota bacterium]
MIQRVEKRVTVTNSEGIHARPSVMIVKLAQTFRSQLTVANDREGVEANARSILDMISLVATQGTELRIVAEGEDAEVAALSIVDLVASGFPEVGK